MNTLSYSLRYILFCALTLGLGSGCNEFLEVQSEDQLSREDLFTTIRGADAAVVGLYYGLGEGSYYQFRMPVYADLPANARPPAEGGGSQGQFLGIQLGLFRLHARELDAALDNTGMEQLYTQAYSILFQANDLLDALSGVTDGSEERLASLAAEARAIRAIVHFDLVRLFAQAPGFTADASHPGIVLLREVPGIFDQPARSSVGEVYDLIRADLELSAAALDPTFSKRSAEPYWLTPTVIYGLLARVNSYVSDWEACRDWADRCIAAAPVGLTPAEDYLDGWREGSLDEVLWQLDLQRLTDDGDDQLLQTPARILGSGNEEPYLKISDDLTDLFSPNDLRRALIVTNEDGQLLSQKWPFGVNTVRNPPLLRLSEVYLLRAEARLELGDLAGATADYLEIHRRALPVSPPPPEDAAGLRAAIREERRRELAFEGHHFFDLGRWGENLVRRDCSSRVMDCVITYPDYRFVLPIPLEARLRNPNLEQTEGY